MGRFNMGFYEDMGDLGGDAEEAQAGYALMEAGRTQQRFATAAMEAGQQPAPLELAALQNFQTGQLLTSAAGYSSASPSGSQTSAGDSSGVFDFFKSTFGSLANAAGQVAPSAFQAFAPKRYAPIFGVQPPAQRQQMAPSGPSTTTLIIGAVVVGGGLYFLTKGSGGGGTRTNPKKGKSRKGKAKGKKRGKSKGSRKGKKGKR